MGPRSSDPEQRGGATPGRRCPWQGPNTKGRVRAPGRSLVFVFLQLLFGTGTLTSCCPFPGGAAREKKLRVGEARGRARPVLVASGRLSARAVCGATLKNDKCSKL